MATLEDSKSKIQQICDVLKKETLDPAKVEAQRLVDEAQTKAQEIIANGGKEAARLIEEAKEDIEKRKSIFESSLGQACKQSLESLRQEIEENLFNQQLDQMVQHGSSDPAAIAKIIDALVNHVQQKGLSEDFSAVIPKVVSKEAVNALLVDGVLSALREKSVRVGTFSGGAKLQLHDAKMTIDISDEALKELVASYVRKDFRKVLFESAT